MKYQPNLWSFIPSRPINDKMWLNKPVKWPIIYVIQQREQERAPHTHTKKNNNNYETMRLNNNFFL